MNAVLNFEDRVAVDAVKALVDRHGVWRVLRAVTAAVLVRRPHREVRGVADLSDHLRQDIGLPPLGEGHRVVGHE